MTNHRTTAKLIPAVAILALAAAACGGSSSNTNTNTNPPAQQARVGGTLTFGADQEPTGFNDLTSKDSGTSVVNVVEGILPSAFITHPDFTVQMNSDLLESANLTSQSPETIVYKIKPAAKWSDGVPIDATDFQLLWKAQNGTNSKFDVASTTGYKDIKSVEGTDNNKTVTVVFTNAFADWRSLFGYLLPAHLVNKMPGGVVNAWNNGFNKKLPVSGGPFAFGSYKPTESLTLVRNDAYYGKKANLDSIIFRFLPESTTQPDALKNGEVQLIYPQPQLDLVSTVKAIPGVVSQTNFGLTFEHFDFNVKSGALSDPAVRKAIATGLNRESLLKRTVAQFSDKAQVLGNRIYVNSQKEYVDNAGTYGKGDVAAATKLLTDAGYTKGADGIFAKGGKKLSFRFSTTAGNKLRETQGELFKAQMKLVGIDIKIDNSTSKVLFGERLPQHNFDIADFAWVATPFATSNTDIYRTGGGQNYGQYSSPAVDTALQKANATLDDQQRTDAFNAIDRQLWTDMATIPLYQKPTFIAYSDKFVNIGDNASSEGPFWNVGTWGLKK